MKKRRLSVVFKYLIIGIISLIIIIPFWDLIINSFKTQEEAAIPNLGLPSKWQIVENYSEVIEKGNLIVSFKNSIIITGISSVLIHCI